MEFVGEASSGLQALEQFRALRPDVTLLDLNLPVMNGVDAIHAIRERARRIRSRLNVWSRPGAGTEVSLIVPASMAYVRRRWTRRSSP